VATIEEWNQRYRTRDELTHEPAPLLVRAAESLPPGRALDLACGAGQNAAWLSSRGWQVVALDGASEAIRLVHELAPGVDARVIDLETDAPLPFDDATFDLVAILFFLHRPLFAEARRVLRPGGVLVSAIRMSGISAKYCVAPGEMRGFVPGFEVMYEREAEIAEIVARKSG
jgi:SAM-dependent methyltransferase